MKRFFELLSIPILVVPVTVIILWLLVDSSSTSQRWFLVFFLNVVFLPLFSVVWLERRKFISDLDLRSRHERLAFLGLMVLVSLVNFLNSQVLSAPKVIQVLNLLVLVLVVLMAVISPFWKISGHLLVLTSVIAVAFLIKGTLALFWGLLLPIVAFHRLYYKHHTIFQVLAGFLLGFLVPLLVVRLLGLS